MRYLVLLAAVIAGTPWENYLSAPTPANADRVNVVSYSSPGAHLSESDVRILENQVIARDGAAFRLALRLYKASDGGNAEALGSLLGRTARAQPEFFLSQVAKLGIPCSQLAWPLNNPGLEYADRGEAQKYEIAKRKEAIRAVTKPSLRTVRADCLRAFR